MAPEPARVAVTGLGVVHGLGLDVASLLAELDAGDEPLEPGDVVECEGFDPEQHRESSKTYMDPCADLLLGACWLAVRDRDPDWSGMATAALDPTRCGMSVGTAFGPTDSMLNMTGRVQQKGLRFGSPMIFTHTFVNAPGALASIEYGLRGPCMTHLLGDQSGAAALAYAVTMLQAGRADLIIAGGVDTVSRPLLAALDAAEDDRPVGEAAAVLVLETADHAAARGVTPQAELTAGVCLTPGSAGALAAALAQADLPDARAVTAPVACGHTFGASVPLAAACGVGLLGRGGAGPLAAGTPDDSCAIIVREWLGG